jgi:integrative and conjugative element protein (TIGR02256 family)
MHATSPGLRDLGTRVSFVRKDPSHQLQARRIWEESAHTVDYLGEWHTHPEVAPSPSSTDRRAWIEVLSARKEQHVFLIAGTLDVIWTGCGEDHTLLPLMPLADVD